MKKSTRLGHAKRSAVSAVMPRRSFTMSAIRVTGTRKAMAILFMLNPSGVMNSSRRISPGCTGFIFFAILSSPLVIIHDLDFIGVAVAPYKAKAPLVIDADAVLALAIALQSLQSVPRQQRERAHIRRRVKHVEFPQALTLNGLEPAHRFPAEKALRISAAESPDHPPERILLFSKCQTVRLSGGRVENPEKRACRRRCRKSQNPHTPNPRIDWIRAKAPFGGRVCFWLEDRSKFGRKEPSMMLIGCDYHPSWQQISWLDMATGETGEKKLEHASGEAEKFYRGLPGPALIGMESTGNCQWFVEMAT